MKRYTLAALALLLVLLPSQQALRADQALYVIQDLGLTPDGLAPTVTGVNAKGQLSGYVSDTPDGNPRAVRFTDGFGWQYLTGLDAAYSVATGINKDGALVGYHLVGSRLLAFRYTDNGGVEDILPIGSGDTTLGFAINDAGEVVGSSSTQGLPSVAFRAAVGTAALAVPPLSKACGINAAGVIVGFGPASHALLYQSETNIIDLGSFEGDAGFSDACAIDENGRVGGWATDAGVGYAFDYAGAALQRLESFGGVFSKTEAIASGRGVGWFMLADGTMHAFTHSDTDGAIDLNAAIAPGGGWVLSTAKGINAAGQIVGEGTKNGNWTTFRLTVAATKDTTAPVFTSLSATPSIIFPPKGQKVTVT